MGFDALDDLLGDTLGGCESTQKVDERPNVMIVDDNRHACDALEAVLGDRYHVVSCYDATSALAALDESFHVVLLDIKMEGVDGFQCFEMMRKRFNHLPIIFHSAYQDLRDPYEVMNALKPFGYLQKGVSEAEMVTILDRAVEYRKKFLVSERKLQDLQRRNDELQQRIKEREEKIIDHRVALAEATGRHIRLSMTDSSPSGGSGSANFEATGSPVAERLYGIGSVVLRLGDELEACRRARQPLLVCLAEVDAFEVVRNREGIKRAENIIDRVAGAVFSGWSGRRLIGRLGDARVALIAPGVNATAAGEALGALKEKIVGVLLGDDGGDPIPRVTVSCGAIGVSASSSPDARKVIALAERSLANARKRGAGAMNLEVYGADLPDRVK